MSATRRFQSDVSSKGLRDEPVRDSNTDWSSGATWGGETGEGTPRGRDGVEPTVELGERRDSGKGRSGADVG